MKLCNQIDTVQDYLEGALDATSEREFREHLETCADCAAEVALFSRVFTSLATIPTWDPGPALTERVMNRVLPSRQRRRRWVQAAGWAYAGLLAVALVGFGSWLLRPATLTFMSTLWVSASHSLVRLAVFTLNAATFSILNVVHGWSALTSAGSFLAPFARALTAILSSRTVGFALLPAALGCAVVLWWMRPRGRDSRGMRHVGLLGF